MTTVMLASAAIVNALLFSVCVCYICSMFCLVYWLVWLCMHCRSGPVTQGPRSSSASWASEEVEPAAGLNIMCMIVCCWFCVIVVCYLLKRYCPFSVYVYSFCWPRENRRATRTGGPSTCCFLCVSLYWWCCYVVDVLLLLFCLHHGFCVWYVLWVFIVCCLTGAPINCHV